MKKISLLLIATVLTINAFAQEQRTKNENLFGDVIKRWSGYGGFTTKLSIVQKNVALLTGGYGGVFLNDKLMLGGGGYGLSSYVRVPEQDRIFSERMMYWSIGYGGFVVEYTHLSNKLAHLTFMMLIGGGGVSQRLENYSYSYNSGMGYMDNTYDDSPFFITEPGLNIEINLTNWMRIGMGGSYRWIYGSDTMGISDGDLSAPAANFSLKFGRF